MDSRIRVAICASFWLPAAALAAEPAWWTQTKQDCINSGGRLSSQYYNEWKGCIGGNGSSVAPSTSVPSIPSGATSQQQMLLNATQQVVPAIQQGIQGIMYSNQLQEEARQAAAARAADQQYQINEQARREAATRQRLLDMQNGVVSSASPAVGASAASPDKAADSQPKSAGYTKGYTDASQCYSQNAGTSCVGDADERQCVMDYRAGFDVGDKQRVKLMAEATVAGQRAGANGELANGGSEPGAEGPCRLQWIETYNLGYFKGKQARAQAGLR
jgi:hypothetical protein